MDIENMNIEKATERCNQLIKPEHANWIGISNQVAIIRVLNELEKKDKEYEELTEASKELCKTVNLMKKVINEMAKHIHLSGDYECLNKECEDDGSIDCEECIKEYFTNKVEKEGIKG